MPVSIKPTSVIKQRLGIDENGPVQSYFVSLCVKKMDKYIPKDEGNLRKIKDITNKYVIYESPYARYQYYGMREDGSHKVRNYTTPGTGPYWDRRMVTADMDTIIDKVQDRFGFGGK